MDDSVEVSESRVGIVEVVISVVEIEVELDQRELLDTTIVSADIVAHDVDCFN